MKKFLSSLFVISFLVLNTHIGFGHDEKQPVDSLLNPGHGCKETEYFDDVDSVCVTGGKLDMVDGHDPHDIKKTLDDNNSSLFAIKGVTSTSIDRHGIRVEADSDHGAIPKEINGMHVHVMPSRTAVAASHTVTAYERPYHAGAAVGTYQTVPQANGTGGPIVLDDNGLFWELLPNHMLYKRCGATSNYPLPHATNTLHNVPRYGGTGNGQTTLYQPVNYIGGNLSIPVGNVRAWDTVYPNTQASWGPDLAVVAITGGAPDRDNVPMGQFYPSYVAEVDRIVGSISEGYTISYGQRDPFIGDTATMYRANLGNSGLHYTTGWISATGATIGLHTNCTDGTTDTVYYIGNAATFNVSGLYGYALQFGDSGSEFVDYQGYYIGMLRGMYANDQNTGIMVAASTDKLYGGYKAMADGLATVTSLTLAPPSSTGAPNTWNCTWASVKNIGYNPAYNVYIRNMTPVSGMSFSYMNQNQQWNVPHSYLDVGQTATFAVCALYPSTLAAQSLDLNVIADNGIAPLSLPGENSYTVTWMNNPSNLYMIPVTARGEADDSIHIDGGWGALFYAVTNYGPGTSVTIQPYFSAGLSPSLNVTSCQWNQPGGYCNTANIAGSWTDYINTNEQRWYAFWFSANLAVPLNYYGSRFFLDVHSGTSVNGTVIGRSGKAIATQWCTSNCAPR